MALTNLKKLREELIKKYRENYSGEEIILPEKFKQKVSKIGSDRIEYFRYTTCITNTDGQKIYLPNQWFYIASYFTEFYQALSDYQQASLSIFTKERLKELNKNALTPEEKQHIEKKYSPEEQSFIEKFVTDYSWWGGGKTIDRGDFYHSPILNMANVVNVSQSYITTLCQFLNQHSELSKLLYTQSIEYNQEKNTSITPKSIPSPYRRFITAIHSKPFILLAGLSGTGKSRIVRELARACDTLDADPWKVQTPENFSMISVKPNWHDSTDLLGYVSRISGTDKFISTGFLEFLIKAWKNPQVPFFLCLDEMNLAPVEQYFAEYLSCLESRKLRDNKIVTDPIFPKADKEWYIEFIQQAGGEDIEEFLTKGISIPQNLIIMGTVNMDETTFTFSRKVLDRAMTIEMNDANLWGGLNDSDEQFSVSPSQLIGDAVEGKDIYKDNEADCDIILKYLETINNALEGTPFRIAYRTRNEFLLYVIENLKYSEDHSKEFCMSRALDEITSMKILSRIEGDESKLKMPDGTSRLKHLQETIDLALSKILDDQTPDGNKGETLDVCHKKLDEMEEKLKNGYCCFWT